MIPIRGVYEVAVKVHDLRSAEALYREVLGLQFALRDDPETGSSCERETPKEWWCCKRIAASGRISILPSESRTPNSSGPRRFSDRRVLALRVQFSMSG